MKRYLVDETTMTALGDAVRSKTNTTAELSPAEMAEKIALIRTHEGDPVLEGVTITPTGTEIVKVPPSGIDGFGIVTVEGDSNLVPENIREGVTIYGIEGAMPEEGIDTSDATATADDIVEGASAYVNGELIVGTHVCESEPTLSEVYISPTGTEFTQEPEEGVDGFNLIVVEGCDELVPENVKSGVTIYGVTGEYIGEGELKPIEVTSGVEDTVIKPEEGYAGFSEITVKGDPDLIPENIIKGKTILGVEGGLVIGGDMSALVPQVVKPSSEYQEIHPPEGYDGFYVLLVRGDVDLVPENVKMGVEIFGTVGSYAGSIFVSDTTIDYVGGILDFEFIYGEMEEIET